MSQIFPGKTPDETVTTQTILVANAPQTEEERAASEAFCDLVGVAVEAEDYAIGFGIQRGIDHLNGESFVFGRNEPAVQNYHRWIARFMALPGAAW